MQILNELSMSHESVKTGFFTKKKYARLQKDQTKDHWERTIEAIEGVIKNHRVDNEIFKKHYDNLKKEVLNSNGLNEYGVKYQDWWRKTHSNVHWLQFKKAEIDPVDFDKFVTELEDQYRNYNKQQNGFLEAVAIRRESVVIARPKYESHLALITSDKANKPQVQDNNPNKSLLILPKELVKTIIQNITDKKVLVNFELVNHYMKHLINELSMWNKLLIREITSNNKFGSTFFNRYSEFKGKDLESVPSPKAKFKQIAHELRLEEENAKLRNYSAASRGDYDPYERKGKFFAS